MKIYKVLEEVRNVLSDKNGAHLRVGDYIHAYGIFMVKVATKHTPYATTSMFSSMTNLLLKGQFAKSFIEATPKEIESLLPYLSRGKKFTGIHNFEKDPDYVLYFRYYKYTSLIEGVFEVTEKLRMRDTNGWANGFVYLDEEGNKYVRLVSNFMQSFEIWRGTRYARQKLMKNPILKQLVEEARQEQSKEIRKSSVAVLRVPNIDNERKGPRPVETCGCNMCRSVMEKQKKAINSYLVHVMYHNTLVESFKSPLLIDLEIEEGELEQALLIYKRIERKVYHECGSSSNWRIEISKLN